LTAAPPSAALLEAAAQFTSSTNAWQLEVVAPGERYRRHVVAPQATLHVLPGGNGMEGPRSWELSELMAPCRLIHLLDPCSLGAAVALLLAQLRGIAVVATEPELPAGLWAALDLRRLVDCVVPADAALSEMPNVYRIVLTTRREAA
jgi:hypothetical protein